MAHAAAQQGQVPGGPAAHLRVQLGGRGRRPGADPHAARREVPGESRDASFAGEDGQVGGGGKAGAQSPSPGVHVAPPPAHGRSPVPDGVTEAMAPGPRAASAIDGESRPEPPQTGGQRGIHDDSTVRRHEPDARGRLRTRPDHDIPRTRAAVGRSVQDLPHLLAQRRGALERGPARVHAALGFDQEIGKRAPVPLGRGGVGQLPHHRLEHGLQQPLARAQHPGSGLPASRGQPGLRFPSDARLELAEGGRAALHDARLGGTLEGGRLDPGLIEHALDLLAAATLDGVQQGVQAHVRGLRRRPGGGS